MSPHLKLAKGPKPQLTILQEIELLAWYKARKALGTCKTKAREWNVPVSTVQQSINRMREREIRSDAEVRALLKTKRARNAHKRFLRDVARAAF